MNTLISEEPVSVKMYPNPTAGEVSVTITNATSVNHTLRVTNTAGVVLEDHAFEGNTTTIDMSRYQRGSYIVSIDGNVVRVIRN